MSIFCSRGTPPREVKLNCHTSSGAERKSKAEQRHTLLNTPNRTPRGNTEPQRSALALRGQQMPSPRPGRSTCHAISGQLSDPPAKPAASSAAACVSDTPRVCRCRTNVEQISQSRPDYGLGLSHFQCDILYNHLSCSRPACQRSDTACVHYCVTNSKPRPYESARVLGIQPHVG